MTKTICTILFGMVAAAAFAEVRWTGFDKSNWISGPKLSGDDLKGKVVMVERWSPGCGPCRKILPHVEELWQKYKDRGLVLVGSEVWNFPKEQIEAMVKANGLTYSIYKNIKLADKDPDNSFIPFAFIVDCNGKVVFSGHPSNDGLESALEKALNEMGAPPSPNLIGDITVHNSHKGLVKQFVLGATIQASMRRLQSEAKGRNEEIAASARAIIEAVEKSKEAHIGYVNRIKEQDPEKALETINRMKKTWPKECDATFKDELPALTKAARAAKAVKRH